jgi:hypothetical protein
MTQAHFFGMYGMGGHTTDPGEDWFTGRVKAEIPEVDIHGSPYRDYDAGTIAGLISQLPDGDIVFVQGTSLGANDCPVVGSYTQHKIHGMFGFQASMWGEHQPVTSNVSFAHLFYSYNPIPLPLLGAYQWTRAVGNTVTNLYLTPKHLPHPGDYDVPSQNIFLAEIKRILAKPGV